MRPKYTSHSPRPVLLTIIARAPQQGWNHVILSVPAQLRLAAALAESERKGAESWFYRLQHWGCSFWKNMRVH